MSFPGPPVESAATLRLRGNLFALHRALAYIRQVKLIVLVASGEHDELITPAAPADPAADRVEQNLLLLIRLCARAMFADAVRWCLWDGVLWECGSVGVWFVPVGRCAAYTSDEASLLTGIENDGQDIH
jgi:hypothetical protein